MSVNTISKIPLASVDVWATQPPSNSVADIAFAPLSTENIELTNDYEPVAYQANRALRAAQSAMELNALQERNHATTAYSTLNCVATPLFPTFDAQRAIQCSNNQQLGVGEYNRRSSGLVQRASSGCDCGEKCNGQCVCNSAYNECHAPPIGYQPGYYVQPGPPGPGHQNTWREKSVRLKKKKLFEQTIEQTKTPN